MRIVFQFKLRSDHLDIQRGAGSFDLKLDRYCHFPFGLPIARQDKRDQQFGMLAGLLPADIRDAHRCVALCDLRIRQQMKMDALREFHKTIAQRPPTAAIGMPIVFAKIGADPYLRAARPIILNVGPRCLEHCRKIGFGAGRVLAR